MITQSAHAEAAADADAAADMEADNSILVEGALQRETSSALGMGASILETPRSVVRIDNQQIKDLSIESVRDIAKIAPSAYTTTQFGGANTPSLRGQSAEVFSNGVLRTPRSNGLPLSFNSVGGMDVVSGPAGVVFGPTGRVGGYVNLVSKAPHTDRTRLYVDASYGSWDDKRLQVDIGGPMNDVLAYRLSYERIDADSYYRYGFMDSHDIYGAVSYDAGGPFTANANIEYYKAKFVENTGINRPTQELIDDGLYYQGTGVGAFYSGVGDPRGFRSVINVTGVTKIDRSLQLVAPGDYASGTNLLAQLHMQYDLGSGLTLSNHTAYEEYTQKQIEYAQRYYNYIPKSYNWQNRFQLNGKFGQHQFVAGVAYRSIDVLAYSDFYNEYLNATDITTNPALYPINTLAGVVAVPGRINEFATPGAAYGVPGYRNAQQGTQDQSSNQWGFFLQGMLELGNLSVLLGGRLDRIHEDLRDPLPPPGVVAAHDTITEWNKAVNTSLTYKFSPQTSIYATFNYNESPVTTNGGGFAAFSGKVLLEQNFHIDNYLYEAGAKTSLFNDTLFASIAGFRQQRSIADQLGNVSKVIVNGGELMLRYQPNENFSASASYSYLDAKLPNARVSAFTRDVYDSFAAPYGTGLGSPNFTALTGTFRMPGLPKHMINAFAKYKFDFGLGASLNGVLTGPMTTSYLGNVKIPTQVQLDATVFYDLDRWTLYANLYNITDEKNWSAAGASQGNDLINADLPFHARVGVRVRF